MGPGVSFTLEMISLMYSAISPPTSKTWEFVALIHFALRFPREL